MCRSCAAAVRMDLDQVPLQQVQQQQHQQEHLLMPPSRSHTSRSRSRSKSPMRSASTSSASASAATSHSSSSSSSTSSSSSSTSVCHKRRTSSVDIGAERFQNQVRSLRLQQRALPVCVTCVVHVRWIIEWVLSGVGRVLIFDAIRNRFVQCVYTVQRGFRREEICTHKQSGFSKG